MTNPNPLQADTTPQQPATPATPTPPEPDYKKELAELREQALESQRMAQYWADYAAKTGVQPQPPPQEEPEDETDVLGAMTEGVKGFDALAAKRGFMKRDEVEELINRKAQGYAKERDLIEEYPDLKKKNSEFFLQTSKTFMNLINNGTPEKIAMEMSARQTELEFLRAGKLRLPQDIEREQKEQIRQQRIAAQSSASYSRPAPDTGDDEEMTPQQKAVCDGMGVKYEDYMRVAKAGVNMKGIR